MIYLASPYSSQDHAVMEDRFDKVCRYTGFLMKQGLVVYSPIVHCHPIAIRVELPRDWGYWGKFDTEMISFASSFMILKLPGWDTSKGVAAERGIAVSLALHVVEVDYTL